MAGSDGDRRGAVSAQTAIAYGQRGWNRQPDGGETRLGGAPRAPSTGGPARSGSGAALSSSWVYGCSGSVGDGLGGPGLHHLAAYITTIVSAR